MKILYVLPGNMYFGQRFATPVDLSCRDIIAASTFQQSTQVLAPQVDDWFSGFNIHPFPLSLRDSTRERVGFAACLAHSTLPDVVVVEEHVPSALRLARKLPRIPVVLHRHSFQKGMKSTRMVGKIRRALKARSYGGLSGIIHVSDTIDQQFAADWPEIRVPRVVIPNGFAVSLWQPAETRAREFLCVGRSTPEKGILEAAQAVALLLPAIRDWRARFILTDVDRDPDYHKEVLTTLAPVIDRVSIEVQIPHADVVTANERAAIAIIPSKGREAFGRTTLEAHAGAAAVISSGRGALREISGDFAVYVDDVLPGALAEACFQLVSNPQQREALARQGHARAVERFGTSGVSARVDEFLAEITGQPLVADEPLAA